MKRFGFTLVEILIAMPISAIVGAAVLMLLACLGSEYQAAALQGDLKLDAQRAASAVFGCAARGAYKIHQDQRGLTFADGTQVRWEGDKLVLGGRALTEHPVREFLAIRRARGSLVVNLVLESPQIWRGRPRPSRFVYDYPAFTEGDL